MRLFKKIVLLFLCISAGALNAKDWTGPELQAVWDAYEPSDQIIYEAYVAKDYVTELEDKGTDISFAECELSNGTVVLLRRRQASTGARLDIRNIPPYRDGFNRIQESLELLYEEEYYAWSGWPVETPSGICTIYQNVGHEYRRGKERLKKFENYRDIEYVYKKVGDAYIHVQSIDIGSFGLYFYPLFVAAEKAKKEAQDGLKWNAIIKKEE